MNALVLGTRMATRITMMETTTNSSISVKARAREAHNRRPVYALSIEVSMILP
jgi:hypothetical protein